MVIAFAALVEILTGFALMTFPGVVVRLVYGADAVGVVITLGRMTGFGLLALGLACWPERGARLSSPAIRALLVYNVLITALFLSLAISRAPVGLLFWPALVLHIVLTVLLVRLWLANRV
jgi:hypothetical protein